VTATPALVAARSKGFTDVTRPAFNATYCLTAPGIDARTVAAVATEDFSGSTGDGVPVVSGNGTQCAAGQFEVITFDLAGNFVNNVGFTLLVP
jgi:hypothetical protein